MKVDISGFVPDVYYVKATLEGETILGTRLLRQPLLFNINEVTEGVTLSHPLSAPHQK